MANRLYRLSGYCLITGSILMALTMLLHPTGGGVEHIAHISTVAIVSHSLGILSTIFVAFGFYGLTRYLSKESNLSYLACCFAGFGLIAVMLAALLNGLVLPMYALKHLNDSEAQKNLVRLVMDYSVTFNAALDYVFITTYTIAMSTWSWLIYKYKLMPLWVAILGLMLLVISIIAVSMRLNFISVFGFTVYVFGIISWIISVSYFLIFQASINQSK